MPGPFGSWLAESHPKVAAINPFTASGALHEVVGSAFADPSREWNWKKLKADVRELMGDRLMRSLRRRFAFTNSQTRGGAWNRIMGRRMFS